ncbi:MAG: hypothetical protein U9P68_05550 [Pseudomonadota bacterium]|nr:hypothetical protein [Pseudomonadota bacterium]
MRWTGLILSIAILGLTASLLLATGFNPSGHVTVRTSEAPAAAAAKPLES